VGAPTVKTVIDTKPSRTDTYNVSAGQTEPNQLPDQGKPTYVDHKFVISTTDKKVDVDLTFPNRAEDYDLEVFRCVNGCGGKDDENVGNSEGPNGQQEHVSIENTNVKPGDYYARAINYLGPTSTWTVTVTHFGGTTTVTPGHKEAWTLTCTAGGKTLSSRQVTIDRGQKLTVNACGA
jgi:hypothetical protein